MSGFEIVGVIVGAIPLIVSGLEHYSAGISIMKNMRQYECVFADINSSFGVSVGIYIESCYKLLAPLNLPDEQMKDLLLENDNEKMTCAWQNAELEQKLVKRLSMNCKSYLSFVHKLNRRILLLAHKLKLGPTFMPPWVLKDGTVDEKCRRKFFSSVWTRVRGGFDSNKCASLLEQIDRDILKISQFTAITLEVEPLRINRSRKLRSSSKNVRENAKSLFEILHLRWSCPCPCQLPHRVNLQLSMHQDHEVNQSDEENTPTRFALLFSFEKNSGVSIPPPWYWRDVEVETSPLAQKISGASVRFNIQPPATAAPRLGPLATSTLQGSVPTSKIDDLCKVLILERLQRCCLGFLEDQQRRHQLFSVPGPGIQNEILDETSLENIIHGNNKVLLGPREKCSIALLLASAVLQLHDTPWLAKSWDLRDICVLKDKSGSYFLDRPYVTSSFVSAKSKPLQKSSRAHYRRLLKNEIVFALGVALLELSYSRPLADLVTPSDLDDDQKVDVMTDYSIASRLATDIHTRELPNYAKAASRCVHCSFDTASYSLTQRAFREQFYEGVVVPLKDDWEYAHK